MCFPEAEKPGWPSGCSRLCPRPPAPSRKLSPSPLSSVCISRDPRLSREKRGSRGLVRRSPTRKAARSEVARRVGPPTRQPAGTGQRHGRAGSAPGLCSLRVASIRGAENQPSGRVRTNPAAECDRGSPTARPDLSPGLTVTSSVPRLVRVHSKRC